MHIPDSMLSPTTSAVMAAAMAPVWAGSARAIRSRLSTREVPLLALGAAFCFTAMMFNIPALGGTTAHPVAGTLLAVMLGPWAAVMGITAALTIQALFFGDGGLFALGANCFTMAFALPFVGYAVYRLLSRITGKESRLQPLCAGVGAYAGIVVASALVAILLGIQPALFHEANGHALYFPFGLTVTLPAMLSVHMLVAGPAEAAVTAAAVAYLQRASVPLFAEGQEQRGKPNGVQHRERAWLGLGVLLAVTPIGLLAKGDAWGEWDAKAVAEQIAAHDGKGYVPRGLQSAEEHAYRGLNGLSDYGSERGPKYYLLAGLLGAGTIALGVAGLGRVLAKAGPNKSTATAPGAVRHRPASDDTALPAWMLTESAPAPTETARKTRNRYLEKTLSDLAGRLNRALQVNNTASHPGLLQSIDPRARLLAVVMLIAPITVSRHLLPPLAALVLAACLAAASGIAVVPFFTRIWLAVPVFVGGIILPSMFSSVTPGREAAVLLQHPHIAISVPGLKLAALLILRTGTAVTLGGLLAITTRPADALRALRQLGVPEAFTMMLAMTHRYTLVLLGAAAEMFEARTSRRVGDSTNRAGRSSAGSALGALFSKTLALSDEVHNAMVSRGFRGSFPDLKPPKWRLTDTAAITLFAIGAVLVAMADRLPGIR